MTNELTKVELYGANNDGTPVRYAVANGISISKGDLLTLLDDRAASSATTAWGAPFAGVASEEHTSGQGVTSVSAWTNGIFEAVASGAIEVGGPVRAADVNKVMAAENIASGAKTLGYALETVTDGETINVRLRL